MIALTVNTPILAHNRAEAAINLVSDSGLVIPKGTPGRILGYTHTGAMYVDFGCFHVFIVPAGSPLVKVGER